MPISPSIDCRHLVDARWCTQASSARVKVENRVGHKEDYSFNVSRDANVDNLLGVCAEHFKQEVNGTIGLYSSDGRLLIGSSLVRKVIKQDETIYLQRKQVGDDCLFSRNWCLWGTFVLLLSLVGIVCATALYMMTGHKAPFKYGVVFDAGSSHTSAHLFRWDAAKANGTGRVFEVTHVTGKRKGISRLSHNETYVEISEILEKLSEVLPTTTSPSGIPVHLAATAGMRISRLNNSEQAASLLCAAATAIRDSEFLFRGVEISDGIDEGISAWVSLNYKLERLVDLRRTIGTMDMGGASVQIAVEVDNADPLRYTKEMQLFGERHRVFSMSSLCFGNDQSYNRYLVTLLIKSKAFEEANFTIQSPCHCNGYSGKTTLHNILGPCTQSSLLPEILNDCQVIDIEGSWDPQMCASIAEEVLNVKACQANGFAHCFSDLPAPLPMDREYVAFSSYYFTVHETRFNSKNFTKLQQTASTFCDLPYAEWIKEYYNNSKEFSAYGCWKINYVTRLFEHKYNFTEAGFSNVRFAQKVNGSSVSWPLGYMLNATNAIPAGRPTPPVLTMPLYAATIAILLLLLCSSFIMFRCHHNADMRKVQGLMFASSL